MFERFTDRARRVVVLAQEEARLLNHNYIGTEHILLGLIHEGDGVAARALELCDVSLEQVRAQVTEVIGTGTVAPSEHIPFTPRAKTVLELSLREALQLGHNYIGTEHVLLGLIREGEGVAAQVLAALGLELSDVRTVVVGLVQGDDPQPRERSTPSGMARAVVGTHVPRPAVAAGPRPAACSFCGKPSPQSGQLFAGTEGALVCVRCAQSVLSQAGSPAGTQTFLVGTSTPRPFVGPPPVGPHLDELVAGVLPTGPPPDDEAAARTEIEHAALHMNERTTEGRGLVFVHDADDLAPYVAETQRRNASFSSRADTTVDAITFVNSTEAVWWRSATLDGRPLPQFRHREGRAVLVDGRWMITRATVLDGLSVAGMFVPPRDDDPPASASPA